MTATTIASPTPPRTAMLQLALLLVVTAIAYLPDLMTVAEFAVRQAEAAHALAAPILVAILFVRRRDLLARSLGRGSILGVVLVALGLLVTFAALWPFNFGLPRYLAAVIVVAGAVLAVCGPRTLWHALPLLLILLLAIPFGQRVNAVLTRMPELLTIRITQAVTEALPGVLGATIEGPDLHYETASRAGTVALGEPARWAALTWSCLTIIVFVTFAVVRPAWQVIALAAAAVPIVLLCNFARVLTWCLATIYGGAGPTAGWPRVAAAIVALVAAYLATILVGGILSHLFVAPTAGKAADG